MNSLEKKEKITYILLNLKTEKLKSIKIISSDSLLLRQLRNKNK